MSLLQSWFSRNPLLSNGILLGLLILLILLVALPWARSGASPEARTRARMGQFELAWALFRQEFPEAVPERPGQPREVARLLKSLSGDNPAGEDFLGTVDLPVAAGNPLDGWDRAMRLEWVRTGEGEGAGSWLRLRSAGPDGEFGDGTGDDILSSRPVRSFLVE